MNPNRTLIKEDFVAIFVNELNALWYELKSKIHDALLFSTFVTRRWHYIKTDLELKRSKQ